MATGLQGNVGTALLKTDEIPCLLKRPPTEAIPKSDQHCTNGARPVVGKRFPGPLLKSELLMLGAYAPLPARFAAPGEKGRQLILVLNGNTAGLGNRHASPCSVAGHLARYSLAIGKTRPQLATDPSRMPGIHGGAGFSGEIP